LLSAAEVAFGIDNLGPGSVLARAAPHAVNRGHAVYTYPWERYKSIGAGTTDVQKDIEATIMQNVVYSEEMARRKTPGIYNANGIWQIGPMIIKWGTDEQKRRWLPGILNAGRHD
jgi:hypothetical protein